MLALWIVLTIGALYFGVLVYVMAQALVGRLFGLKVERVAVGFDIFKAYISWPGRRWEWRLGFIPLGGYTKFRSDQDEEPPTQHVVTDLADPDCYPAITDAAQDDFGDPPPPGHASSGSYDSAPAWARLCVSLAGPVSQAIFGVLLIAIPVLMGSGQMRHVSPAQTDIKPCAAGGLAIEKAATTVRGQLELVESIGAAAFLKYALFAPLEDWGGVIGSVVTCAAAGSHSPAAWLSAVGCLMLVIALANLLPVPCLNGWNIIIGVVEMVSGRRILDRYVVAPMLLGYLVLLTWYGRILVADAMWLWRLAVG